VPTVGQTHSSQDLWQGEPRRSELDTRRFIVSLNEKPFVVHHIPMMFLSLEESGSGVLRSTREKIGAVQLLAVIFSRGKFM
jgi:hypothetical protein